MSPVMQDVARHCSTQAAVAHVTGVWRPSGKRVYTDLNARNVPYVISLWGDLSQYSFHRGRLKQ